MYHTAMDERDWAMPPIASHSFSVALSNTKYEDGISILRYFYRGECVSLPHPLPFLLRGVQSDVFPLYSHIIGWAETESGEYRHWRLTPSLPSPSSSTGSSRVVLMCSPYILNGLLQMRMVGNTATCLPTVALAGTGRSEEILINFLWNHIHVARHGVGNIPL